MLLREINILNYKNIRETTLRFSDKLNCFVGLNGQGKTNLLDAIYYLSFTKSAYNTIDSQNISHDQDIAMIQGQYVDDSAADAEISVISCGIPVVRPVKELKRFQRVELAAGETKTVTFELPVAELAFWNIDMEYVVEPGDFRLWVAGDSDSGNPVNFAVL